MEKTELKKSIKSYAKDLGLDLTDEGYNKVSKTLLDENLEFDLNAIHDVLISEYAHEKSER